ncbi:MAG: deoxyribodipyrimidine photo-lyase [Spirochaetia bacterium]|jgi:deoxyribodipyrimidine photo-lyase|nr:deoxyribodipyrimidine photo-lyase [Spirochaetia bacterium]
MNITDLINVNHRINPRKEAPLPADAKCVVYWMQRSQRAFSNQALDAAVNCANSLSLPLAVVFNLVKNYPGSTERHYRFMLNGLLETGESLEKSGAAFFVLESDNEAHEAVIRFTLSVKGALLVSDENPLKIPELWRRKTAEEIPLTFLTVDSDVVVPSCLFEKEEYAARTLRRKIKPLIELYLENDVNTKLVKKWNTAENTPEASRGKYWYKFPEWKEHIEKQGRLKSAESGDAGFKGGRKEGLIRLYDFMENRLSNYALTRNKPEIDGTSRLSPYLHFGQISPAETAIAAFSAGGRNKLGRAEAEGEGESRDAFIEELIVRRELAVNYVLRNNNYDSFDGFHEWAKKSLMKHLSDKREYIYSVNQFEYGQTHDLIWNAAQYEMRETGFMHGYMRMYWAKKILQWSPSPREAFDTAIYLNDKYQLDGRDPNSYTGIAWSIGGKHDRPWGPERPVFGLIRFMNANGMKRKFDTAAYISIFS